MAPSFTIALQMDTGMATMVMGMVFMETMDTERITMETMAIMV